MSIVCYKIIGGQISERNNNISSLQAKLKKLENAKSPINDAIIGYRNFNNKVNSIGYEPNYTWFMEQPAWTNEDEANSEKNQAAGDKLIEVTKSVMQRLAYLEDKDVSLVKKWANDTHEWVNGLHFYKNEVYTYDFNKIDKTTLDDYVDELTGRNSVLNDEISSVKSQISKEKANRIMFFF